MKRKYRFYIYIMSNYRRTCFYIGVTNNLVKRVIEHRYKIGSFFTSKYNLKHLLYYETYRYINDAVAREKELKKWRRQKKIDLIKSKNSKMEDLAPKLFSDYGYSKKDIAEYAKYLKNLYK